MSGMGLRGFRVEGLHRIYYHDLGSRAEAVSMAFSGVGLQGSSFRRNCVFYLFRSLVSAG